MMIERGTADYISDSEKYGLLASEESENWEFNDQLDDSQPLNLDAPCYSPSSSRPSLCFKKDFVQIKIYKTRWVILILFSLLTFMQVVKSSSF